MCDVRFGCALRSAGTGQESRNFEVESHPLPLPLLNQSQSTPPPNLFEKRSMMRYMYGV